LIRTRIEKLLTSIIWANVVLLMVRLRLLKTLKISDEAHAKLISVVGRLMAETGKMKRTLTQ
jgi:hypothetical protein